MRAPMPKLCSRNDKSMYCLEQYYYKKYKAGPNLPLVLIQNKCIRKQRNSHTLYHNIIIEINKHVDNRIKTWMDKEWSS